MLGYLYAVSRTRLSTLCSEDIMFRETSSIASFCFKATYCAHVNSRATDPERKHYATSISLDPQCVVCWSFAGNSVPRAGCGVEPASICERRHNTNPHDWADRRGTLVPGLACGA